MYKDAPEFRLMVYRQCNREYGELTSSGEYQIGEMVKFDNGQAKGTVAWKYQNPEQGLVYILEDYSGFPFKISSKEIISKV